MIGFTIGPLKDEDKGYAIASWRESHKQSPGSDRVPWSYYKATVGAEIASLVNDPETRLLAAYAEETDKLLGWIAATPGKRVHVLHWVAVKHDLDGVRLRRRGIMMALLEAAELGPRFVYTMRARRDRAQLPDGSMSKSLDETLAVALQQRGHVATYVALKDWLK